MKVIASLSILALVIFLASCAGTVLEEPPVTLEGLPAIEIKIFPYLQPQTLQQSPGQPI